MLELFFKTATVANQSTPFPLHSVGLQVSSKWGVTDRQNLYVLTNDEYQLHTLRLLFSSHALTVLLLLIVILLAFVTVVI